MYSRLASADYCRAARHNHSMHAHSMEFSSGHTHFATILPTPLPLRLYQENAQNHQMGLAMMDSIGSARPLVDHSVKYHVINCRQVPSGRSSMQGWFAWWG